MPLNLLADWSEAGLGAHPSRLLVERWLAGHTVSPRDDLPACHQPPARFLERWPQLGGELEVRAKIVSRHPSEDGSERLLIGLRDGQAVESVLLPREGLCVSTQIGCAVGCLFCKTGEAGLLRQLGADEILAQVALAGRERRARGLAPLRKIVLMGMGEPAHNLPNVLVALQHLGTEGRFAHKQLVFSTVGDPRAFEALAQHSVRPALALSLHSLDDEVRRQLLPRAPRLPAAEVLGMALEYAASTRYVLQLQWTLLRSINDGPRDIEALTQHLRGAPVIVNVIPWNHVDGMGFERPRTQTSVEFVRALKRGGVFATIRQSAGQEVDGGCGQLRARAGQLVGGGG